MLKQQKFSSMATTKNSQIAKIIEKLTSTGKKTLDPDLMKKLGDICKASDDNINSAYYTLMVQLRRNHSEVRYSTLLIINELFLRSYVFRNHLQKDLDEFLELVVETNLNKPLPLPQLRGKELKLKGLEYIQNWANEFGDEYIRLRLALNFLKNCKKVDFNDMEARNEAQRRRDRQEKERLERMLNERINKIKSEMIEVSDEISNILLQIENCFKLLVPHASEELFSSEDFDTVDNGNRIDVNNSKTSNASELEDGSLANSLRHHGIHDIKKTITIEIAGNSEFAIKDNDDTSPVIENLNDLQKQMSTRYLPLLTNWLKTLTKGSDCTDTLKKAIDLKNLIVSALQKCKDLQIKPDIPKYEDDEEDDDFIEVKEKDGFESETFKTPVINPISKPSTSKDLSAVEKAYMWKLKHSNDDIKDPTSAASTLNKLIAKSKTKIETFIPSCDTKTENDKEKSNKSKLLEKAPVLPYDIDLYHWEEEKPLIPEVVKFDSLHKFWETKDDDNDENELLKEEQIASLRTRKIDFSGKFEPVKWSCRAPMPSGKLCPRKDRFKCPFHGKIIKRDEAGNPIDAADTAAPSTSSTSVPEWQDPALLRDIKAATGIDLKLPEKGKKRKKEEEGGLTNIKKITSNPRERLNKKILKRFKHYSKKLDDVERKKYNDKFGDQWNYY
ncbi:UV-stimulated scaffold protein A [Caerostris darwini]|uniref:UV-stimulated scaffold protein A n=1 Tax=Caerostris darwini TaxID=1538125 RepID=A0AAV4TAP5_9ARAC|nr:UV-stimulated scaffold protein A [Caerostris darwini]